MIDNRCGNRSVRIILWIALLSAFLWIFFPAVLISADDGDLSFDMLCKRLVGEGFDEARIRGVYTTPAVSLEVEGVSQFFMHSEAKLNYDQFLSQGSLQNARQYMKSHRDELARAEKKYGVDKEIITAIISVETRLGVYLGSKSIIGTLSTLASLTDPGFRQAFWGQIPPSKRVTRKVFNAKADKRGKWAYGELKAFLPYAWNEGIDPVTIKGSYAGAFGISQFVPTSVAKHARDGDKDGRIDLFNHADAIASVASYLKFYKWHSGIDRKKGYRVLLHYNYSKPYANTILDIRERLKG